MSRRGAGAADANAAGPGGICNSFLWRQGQWIGLQVSGNGDDGDEKEALERVFTLFLHVDKFVSSVGENDAAISARGKGGVSTAMLWASGEADRHCPHSRAPARQHLCWTLRDPDRCLGVPRSRSRCVRTFTSARWVRTAAPKERERAPETAQTQYALPFTPPNDLRKEI